ncbi:MAG: hypothetical protein V1698_00045 [bacterium]
MKKIIEKIGKLKTALMISLLTLLPKSVLAIEADIPTGNVLDDHGGDFATVVDKIINQALIVLGGVAICLIIYGGFLVIFGGVDKAESAKKGRSIITYTIIGIVVIALAAFIVKWALTII